MEVELETWTKGPQLALSFFDDWFRKRTCLAQRNDAPLPHSGVGVTVLQES